MTDAARQQAVDRLIDSVSEEEIEEREAMAEGDPHLDTKVIARDTLRSYFDRIGRSLYIGADIKVYYPGEKGFTPDLIAVLDAVQRTRHCWMVSQEGKGVDLALEVHDRGSWRKDFVDNVQRYAALGIGEYFIVDLSHEHLKGYRLTGKGLRTYQPIVPDRGRLRSNVLGLDLVMEGGKLRFYFGTALLLGYQEMLAVEQRQVQSEQARADSEQERATHATARLASAVIEILRLRGLVATDAQAKRIRNCTELPVLERWMDRALKVDAVDAIFADD